MPRKLRRSQGSIFIIALGVVYFIAIINAALLVRVVSETNLSRRSSEQHEALHLAESAVDQALVNLRSNNAAAIASTHLATGTYWAEIVPLSTPQHYQINAHSLVGSKTRDVEATAQQSPNGLFQHPLFGRDTIDLKKGALTDSYDSRSGPYDPDTAGSNGNIATNSTAPGSIRLRDGTAINGQLIVGAGMADPSIAVDMDASSIVTGNPPIVSMPQPLSLPSVNTTGLSCSGNLNLPKNATFTWTQAGSPYCYNQIKADVGSVIAVSGNVVVYANQIDFSKNLSVNADGNPTQLVLQVYGSTDVLMDQETDIVIDKEGVFKGGIYAPTARVRFNKMVDFYGSLVANDVEIDKESQFHYDQAFSDVTSVVGSYRVTLKSWRDL